jgi:hypothetical protein
MMPDTNPIPKDLNVTVTMTARQMRAVIDATDLTVSGNNLSAAESGVLYLMAALQQAEALFAVDGYGTGTRT